MFVEIVNKCKDELHNHVLFDLKGDENKLLLLNKRIYNIFLLA